MYEQLSREKWVIIWYAVPHFIPAITSDQAVSKKIISAYNLLALTTSTTSIIRTIDDTG